MKLILTVDKEDDAASETSENTQNLPSYQVGLVTQNMQNI